MGSGIKKRRGIVSRTDEGTHVCEKCEKEADEVQWQPGSDRTKRKRQLWCVTCAKGEERWVYDKFM